MSEIKHQFTAGKMNKDLDERLVPNGEYRDALNIEVSTSEGSHVGTVQNILGNSLLEGQGFMSADATCVGSIADEKNDRLYWFVASAPVDMILRADADGIELVFVDVNKDVLRFDGQIITGINIIDDMLFWTDNINEPRKINIQRSILGSFNGSAVQTKLLENGVITANDVEERHITVIKRAPTRPLVIDLKTSREYGRVNAGGDPVSYTGVFEISDDPSNTNDDVFEVTPGGTGTPFATADFNNVFIGDNVKIFIPEDSSGNADFELDWLTPTNVGGSTSGPGNAEWAGTDIVIREFTTSGVAPQLPILNYRIKGVLTSWTNNDNLSLVSDFLLQNAGDNAGRIMVEFTVSAITGAIPDVVSAASGYTSRSFAIDLFDVTEKLHEFKFPRFSYRYKYEDGEYSTFAPFTEVAFVPGSFDYFPKKGYNLGMTNTTTSIVLSNYVPNDIPKDVVEVDILYKEEGSPNIYSVETIRKTEEKTILFNTVMSNNWDINSYEILDETVNTTLPSNQLLRPWDNVPKKARAQEITGNRIVYANYLQGLDLSVSGSEEKYYPKFNHVLTQHAATPRPSLPSIKTLREYQLGVVFIDRYGRETPILSNPTGTFKVEKVHASSANRLKAGLSGPLGFLDQDIQYFKFFIKETSGEYYNLSMDRFYDAGDGNRWLSFPSSDRNKVDTDTFLILKKATESNALILDPARYKILAIENEAPDYIKLKRLLIETNSHIGGGTNSIYYSGTIANPIKGNRNIVLNYDNFDNSTGAALDEIDDGVLWIEFGIAGTPQRSKRYEINKITKSKTADTSLPANTSTFDYHITLREKLGADVDFISDDTSGLNITGMAALSTVRFYKYTVKNAAEYDGRFFAKIYADNLFEVLFEQYDINTTFNYVGTHDQKVYSMMSANNRYSATQIGQQDPEAVGAPQPNSGYYAFTQFRRFASYFRNYVYANSNEGGAGDTFRHGNTAAAPVPGEHYPHPLGRFRFGPVTDIGDSCNTNDKPRWIKEYMQQTGPGNGNPGSNYGAGDLWWTYNNSVAFNTSCGGGQWGTYKQNWMNWGCGSCSGNYSAFLATIPDDAAHVRDQEIWFIDHGPKVAVFPNNNLDWSSDVASAGNNPGLNTASATDFSMELGFGPIYNATTSGNGYPGTYWSDGSSGNGLILEDAYDIGNSSPNASTYNWYNDQPTIDTVTNLGAGYQWRWKEDPNSFVYTNDQPTTEQQNIRYAIQNSPAHDGNSGAPYGLNPNFTKSWGLTCTSSDSATGGLDASSWIPAVDNTLGPIANGHSIAINSYTHAGQTAINLSAGTMEDYFIYLDTPTGSGISTATNQETNLTIGMIVVSYDDGSKNLNGTFASVPTNPYLAIKSIDTTSGTYTKIGLTGYVSALDTTHCFTPTTGQAIVFEQPLMNGHSPNQAKRISWHLSDDYSGDLLMAIGYTMEWVTGFEEDEASIADEAITTDPAIWETEPKEDMGLDIYYEISGYNAVNYNAETIRTVLPTGSTIIRTSTSGSNVDNLYTEATVTSNISSDTDDAVVTMDVDVSNLVPNDILKVTRPDGSIFEIAVGTGTATLMTAGDFIVSPDIYGYNTLNWFNCYTFFNGVESDRIRDNFNLPQLTSGVKVSTTLRDGMKEEHRKYGLIFSGIYNSISGTNDLNQFIAAEKITKDINPIYGSIQKLHSRDSDLVTLCEDKCLKILANKDAIYNADGNPQLTANARVLGQTIPFSGEFGISKNPASFASESYRAYFTDKVRGAVMRLSKDGLTPISMHGMKDWFRDNLKLSNNLIGSYDDRGEEYNLTFGTPILPSATLIFSTTAEIESFWYQP